MTTDQLISCGLPTKVVQVLATRRSRGTRMPANPTLVKQECHGVALLGMALWRQLTAAGSSNTVAAEGTPLGQAGLSLMATKIQQQFAAQSGDNKQFVGLPNNLCGCLRNPVGRQAPAYLPACAAQAVPAADNL